MNLQAYRAQQGSFSPLHSPGLSTNPDLSTLRSQSTSPSATTTLIYQPNPLIPPRSILKSIPWGKEEDEHLQVDQQQQNQQHRDLELGGSRGHGRGRGHELSFVSPMNSPSYLLPNAPPTPLGAVGGGVNGGLAGLGELGMGMGGGGGQYGGGNGWNGNGNTNGGFQFVKSSRRITPYRGFAYTPTRPSTGRLSRLTAADPNRDCSVFCWALFLFACCAIWTLGGMWLFQVLIFAHRDWPIRP